MLFDAADRLGILPDVYTALNAAGQLSGANRLDPSQRLSWEEIADRWTKRWAALEERLVKRVIGAGARISRGDKPLAPWFELYARVV